MNKRYQRGALSLLWTAVVVALISLAAMTALMSMRHERNLFTEALTKLRGTEAGQKVREATQAAEAAVRTEPVAIRRCAVNGKIVYSNVECAAGTTVQLHDSRGIEAPKAPAADTAAAPALQDKMIERAVQK
ncbi:DUF4124 domain-containing protein [Oxalobacteraceae bacterium OM1]|nr:DUF4124 domain-containing protein [Oxalobacteraceae bacterium OM1]